MSILLVLFVIALSSCTFESTIPITLSIAEEHPFEELYGKDMWYELSYADGRETKTVHIAPGIRDVTVQVYSGGLRMFVMKPLGELGAIGGFFEPGDDSHVALISEEGEFADILLDNIKESSSITSLEHSVESHYCALAAEESRPNGGRAIDLDHYRNG